MGVKKYKDRYFIFYGKTRIEVSEELYRVWAYYTNKEHHTAKHYSPRLVHIKGKECVLPSRLISFEDYITAKGLQQDSPSAAFNRSVVKNLLIRCIKALPEKQGKTIMLSFFEGFSEKKIATILNVCQSSVSNYKRDALITLKKLILFEGYTSDELFSMLGE